MNFHDRQWNAVTREDTSIPKLIVASVPHTGTQSAEMLLKVLGVTSIRIHAGGGELPESPGWKLLIPQRDPGNVYLSHYNRFGDKAENVEGMYRQLKVWCIHHPSIMYPVDAPVPPEYWGNLMDFLEVDPLLLASGEFLSFIHAGHKYGSAVHQNDTVELPDWIALLRYEMGYTEPFNPAGDVATPRVAGYDSGNNAVLPSLR